MSTFIDISTERVKKTQQYCYISSCRSTKNVSMQQRFNWQSEWAVS